MRVGDIITDGSVKWVVRHIDHPKAGVIVDWQSAASMGDGFLKCTGAGIDPNVYPLLKNILPLVGGKLILPDRRGVVPRGLDDGRGLDVGRVLGSFQECMIESHIHTMRTALSVYTGNTGNAGSGPVVWSLTSATNVYGGTETRMRNVATTYWICYA